MIQQPSSSPQPLLPHTAIPAPGGLELTASAEYRGGQLLLCYWLRGDLEQLRLPPQDTTERSEGLWQHSCFEAFVQKPGQPGYTEFNFSPSGAWTRYHFSGYRQPLPVSDSSRPSIRLASSSHELELKTCVELPDEQPVRLGLSAVLEDRHGALSYWALHHPAEKPDFHHPDSFVLDLAGG